MFCGDCIKYQMLTVFQNKVIVAFRMFDHDFSFCIPSITNSKNKALFYFHLKYIIFLPVIVIAVLISAYYIFFSNVSCLPAAKYTPCTNLIYFLFPFLANFPFISYLFMSLYIIESLTLLHTVLADSSSCCQCTHECTDNYHWITFIPKKTLKHEDKFLGYKKYFWVLIFFMDIYIYGQVWDPWQI